jgi:hypothetical protein
MLLDIMPLKMKNGRAFSRGITSKEVVSKFIRTLSQLYWTPLFGLLEMWILVFDMDPDLEGISFAFWICSRSIDGNTSCTVGSI